MQFTEALQNGPFFITTLALFSVFLLLRKFFTWNKGPNSLKVLPGPRGLPIVGSLFSIGHKPHLTLGEWVQHYGKIFLVKLFHIRLVVISDPKLAREAYNNPLLCGKPEEDCLKIFTGGRYGLMSTDGEDWSEQRRFTMKHLRDFGFGKKSVMEDLMMDEVTDIVDWFKSQSATGQAVSLHRKFGVAVINSLWRITTGHRFQQDDPRLVQLTLAGDKAIDDMSNSAVGVFFPKLAKMFPKLTKWDQLMDSVNKLNSYFIETIEEHKKKGQGQNVDGTGHGENAATDFIDQFLQEMRKTTDPRSSFYGQNGEKSLLAGVFEIFLGGTVTQSSTLTWTFLYLASFPEKQRALQHEIDRVVGKNRTVKLEDRQSLLYTEAVIQETLRKSSRVPLGVFHSAMDDTTLGPYKIPKGTWLCINHHFIHHDPDIWENPEEFSPERFLTTNNKRETNADESSNHILDRNHHGLLPFSVGKRICPGMDFSRDNLFLIIANIYQRFSVSFDPTSPKPPLESRTNLFADPHFYKVVIEERAGF